MTTGENSEAGSFLTQSEPQSSGDQALPRFFSKLLSEALHLQTTKLVFEQSADVVQIRFFVASIEVKTSSIKVSWLPHIERWIRERKSYILEPGANASKAAGDMDRSEEFYATFRVAERMLSVNVKSEAKLNGTLRLVLSDFGVLGLSQALRQYGVTDFYRGAVEEILNLKSGMLVVVAPQERLLSASLGSLLSLSGYPYLGPLKQVLNTPSMLETLQMSPGVVSAIGPDSLATLFDFRELRAEKFYDVLEGIICQGLVRRVCDACARATVIEKASFEVLPQELRPPKDATYLIGRGCADCGHTGFKGWVAVQNVFRLTPELRTMVKDPATLETTLINKLYPQVMRPLIEDGLEKVCSGVTTFECLFQLTKGVPQAYINFLGRRQTEIVLTEEKLKVPENFFVNQAQASKDPLRGRGAFTGRPEDASDENAPLFSPGQLGKAREKPLLLVVEDDVDQRGILELVFKAAHYDVALAKDGIEALEKIQKDAPDLIISDLMMPRMDGKELVTRLKSQAQYRHIPVLVLTVVADVDKEYTLLDLGADDYCEKTIQRKILLKRVENLLKRAQRDQREAHVQ